MLKIYFDGKLLEFSDDSLKRMYINEGAEGIVYRYGDDAIKIYKPYCFTSRLNEEQCKKLGTISTKRVLVPEKIAYADDCKTFIGYSTPFVKEISCGRIINMSVEALCDELDIIMDDLSVLADNGIEIDDWHIGNVLYNGKLIMGDPGRMIFRRNIEPEWSLGNSRFILNRFLKDDLFSLVRLSNKRRQNIEKNFDDFEDLVGQMRDSMKTGETVRCYVKRMTR